MLGTVSVDLATRPHLTVDEFAERERISRASVYNHIASGALKTLKVGRCRRIPWSAVVEYEESAAQAASTQQA